uniref:Uncharacterized protein n=1 Tax=Rhizophora mucronata TaxID=61149 RepID=A0A2P2IIT9_RHIMU
MIRTALNSASQHKKTSTNFLSHEIDKRASPDATSSPGGDKKSAKRSATCFWSSSRSSSSCSWSMDITWFRRMLILPRNDCWFSVAGMFQFLFFFSL